MRRNLAEDDDGDDFGGDYSVWLIADDPDDDQIVTCTTRWQADRVVAKTMEMVSGLGDMGFGAVITLNGPEEELPVSWVYGSAGDGWVVLKYRGNSKKTEQAAASAARRAKRAERVAALTKDYAPSEKLPRVKRAWGSLRAHATPKKRFKPNASPVVRMEIVAIRGVGPGGKGTVVRSIPVARGATDEALERLAYAETYGLNHDLIRVQFVREDGTITATIASP